MAEKEYLSNEKEAHFERSSEDIRQNIAKEKESISQKVDQINERIKQKLDWREYVRDSPFWAIGVAAGLGYIGSRVLITPITPMERLMDSIAGEVRGSLGGLTPGPGLIKLTLMGIALKTAAGWVKNAASTKLLDGAAGQRPPAEYGSTVSPSAGNQDRNKNSPSSREGLGNEEKVSSFRH